MFRFACGCVGRVLVSHLHEEEFFAATASVLAAPPRVVSAGCSAANHRHRPAAWAANDACGRSDICSEESKSHRRVDGHVVVVAVELQHLPNFLRGHHVLVQQGLLSSQCPPVSSTLHKAHGLPANFFAAALRPPPVRGLAVLRIEIVANFCVLPSAKVRRASYGFPVAADSTHQHRFARVLCGGKEPPNFNLSDLPL